MVLYQCPRCGFKNKIKTKMRNHYYRKKPCEIIHKDISIAGCLDLLEGNSLKIPENIPENIPEKSLNQGNSLKTLKNIPKFPEKFPEKISQKLTDPNLNLNNMNIPKRMTRKSSSKIKKFICNYCNKSFTRKDNLKVHMHKHCRGLFNYVDNSSVSDDSEEDSLSIDTSSNEEDIIETLKNQLMVERVKREKDQEIINDLRNQVGLLIEKVGDTYTTNTYNIVINPFGQENTDYITKDYIQRIIDEGPYDTIPKLLEYIHFNPKHKENHNIKITNKKQPYAQVYDGNKWLIRDKKQTIDDMSDKAYSLLNEHYTWQNEYMNKFQSEYDEKAPELVKRIYKDVEISILNFQKNK